jgi:hypothetical protein
VSVVYVSRDMHLQQWALTVYVCALFDDVLVLTFHLTGDIHT